MPETDTSPSMAQEEVIPATGTQTVPMETREEAAELVTSEVPAQPQQTPSVAPQGESAVASPAEPPAANIPVETPEPAPDSDVDTALEEPVEEASSTPATTGDIYSVVEAIRVGNEYAQAQYGVTVDTGMTAADSSYYSGTADSVAWLAEYGGQAGPSTPPSVARWMPPSPFL